MIQERKNLLEALQAGPRPKDIDRLWRRFRRLVGRRRACQAMIEALTAGKHHHDWLRLRE